MTESFHYLAPLRLGRSRYLKAVVAPLDLTESFVELGCGILAVSLLDNNHEIIFVTVDATNFNANHSSSSLPCSATLAEASACTTGSATEVGALLRCEVLSLADGSGLSLEDGLFGLPLTVGA